MKIIVISCVLYIIVRCFLKFTGSKSNKWMEILIGGMLLTFLLFFWVETKQFAGCSLVSVCGIDRLLLGSRPKSERKINIFSFLIMIRLSIIDIYSSTFTCSLIMTTKNVIDFGIFLALRNLSATNVINKKISLLIFCYLSTNELLQHNSMMPENVKAFCN